MKHRTLFAIIGFGVLSVVSAQAESVADVVDKGNEAYVGNQLKEALEQYQIAETELPESPELDYNIAGVLHQQGKFEEAVDRYSKALNSTDIDVEARAHYNLGGTHFRMGDYQKAIESYQKALTANPDDMDAKYNLELARKLLKEQMKPKDQQDDQDKQDQEKQQQEQQEQQKKQQEQEEQDQQSEQEKQQQQGEDPAQPEGQPEDKQQEEQQQQQIEEKQMSKEDAERILNALKDDEQDVQKKIKRAIGGDYRGKDW